MDPLGLWGIQVGGLFIGSGSPSYVFDSEVWGHTKESWHTGLDVIGTLEPTPIADILNAGLYGLEGDWANAGISACGMLPYAGDGAKLGRLGRKLQKAPKMIPCFSAGTKVSTPDGDKNIEDIKVGDTVYAYDFEARKVVERKVTETPRHFTYCWVEVQVDGETIAATRKHLFWVDNERCWTEAASLEEGMVVRLREGKLATISAVTLRELEQWESTYNLVVEGEHNYFVSGNGVLVHNGYPESPQYPPPTQVGENFQFNFDTSPNCRNSRAAGVARALQEGYIEPGQIGHHINSVKTHPHLAPEPANVQGVNTFKEHLQKHGGDFRNPTSGPLLPKPGC